MYGNLPAGVTPDDYCDDSTDIDFLDEAEEEYENYLDELINS